MQGEGRGALVITEDQNKSYFFFFTGIPYPTGTPMFDRFFFCFFLVDFPNYTQGERMDVMVTGQGMVWF